MMLTVSPQHPVLRGMATALAVFGLAVASAPAAKASDFCPNVYNAGVFNLNINPAFMHIDEMTHSNGQKYDGLIITSFYNAIKDPSGEGRAVDYFERDLVARIQGIGYRSPSWWNPTRDTEYLSDQDLANPVKPSAPGQAVWPNEAQLVPDGILPFEGIVVPEGFHTSAEPGRLTIINLDDPGRETYLVHQSTYIPGEPCTLPNNPNHNPDVVPRFYHLVKWFDMDGDGLKDIVTVRSGFKVQPGICWPPNNGEVVWFKNPGAAIDKDTPWPEFILSGYPTNQNSADISLDMYDFEGDGVPEIVGGNFFTGEAITLYGAPVGGDWTDVNAATAPPRTATLTGDQGWIFGVRVVDLNRDGKMDILASNHQSDNCFTPTMQEIPGRVIGLEQPLSGDIFNDPWTVRILKDDIRPNPTFPEPSSGPGRLAPGLAQEIWPTPFNEFYDKPYILVGGDEASKVWLLKPQSQDPNDWNYDSAVIFDINEYYGPNTSQSLTAPAPATGVSISTIGGIAWHYDRDWTWGSYAEIYIPVFEGRDIHRITFRPGDAANQVVCTADGALACPAP